MCVCVCVRERERESVCVSMDVHSTYVYTHIHTYMDTPVFHKKIPQTSVLKFFLSQGVVYERSVDFSSLSFSLSSIDSLYVELCM